MNALGLSNQYTTKYLVSQENIQIIKYEANYNKKDKIKDIYFVFNNDIKFLTRSPSSLIDAISRLGGILAIIQFKFIIEWVNKRQLKKQLDSENISVLAPKTIGFTHVRDRSITDMTQFTKDDISSSDATDGPKVTLKPKPTLGSMFSIESIMSIQEQISKMDKYGVGEEKRQEKQSVGVEMLVQKMAQMEREMQVQKERQQMLENIIIELKSKQS
ncbi:hypothetical protein FGO68_gene6522 [Halteria grandinella]|uniref:Uncharacterized protein n=1 Tax=Halteria grandinella TaxID=5974 RepID=A0A8J8NRV7_HALGN|nr:hypothetical protein FGO68_gene6522 [Halteria grandinella]